MKELNKFRKFLNEGRILKENAPGYDNRKFGHPLPTLNSVQEAFEEEGKRYESNEDDAYMAIGLKSNIDQTWNNAEDLENDLMQYVIALRRMNDLTDGQGMKDIKNALTNIQDWIYDGPDAV